MHAIQFSVNSSRNSAQNTGNESSGELYRKSEPRTIGRKHHSTLLRVRIIQNPL